MKRIVIVLLLLFAFTNCFSKDKFIGVWINKLDKEEIEIYKEGNYYYAKTNSTVVLIQMVFENETKLYGGTYFDKEKNTELEAKVKLIDDSTLMIKLINGIRIFNKKIIFKRKIISIKFKKTPFKV